MDGYAVRGVDVVGALPDRPVEMRVVGEGARRDPVGRPRSGPGMRSAS